MVPLNKRQVLYDILADCGYSDWFVVEPPKQNPNSIDTKCILFNLIERRKAEGQIPNAWFQDPRRYHAIAELIILAINNSSYAVSDSTAHDLFDICKSPADRQSSGKIFRPG